MVEVNAALAAERINKQIVALPEQFREVFRGLVKNAIQSGYFVGQQPATDLRDRVIAAAQRRPLLLAIMEDPAEPEERKLQAHQEFQAGERLLRETFP